VAGKINDCIYKFFSMMCDNHIYIIGRYGQKVKCHDAPIAIQTLQGHICAWRGQIGFKAIFSKYVSGLVDGNAGELLV
jgi:hypothetical protein